MKLNKGKGAGRPSIDDVLSQHACEPDGEKPTLDRATQSRIGDQLRAMYTELLDQPVPDRFRDLLTRLDQTSNADEGAER